MNIFLKVFTFLDSAYPSKLAFLITPFLDAIALRNPRMQRFNHCFVKARVIIECVIGRLKKRFYVLKSGIRFPSMTKAAKLVKVCCMLHNFILEQQNNNDDFPHSCEDDHEDDSELLSSSDEEEEEERPERRNMATREKILLDHFFDEVD